MSYAAQIAIAIVALLHFYFLVLVMFLWTKPAGLRAFGLTPEQAVRSPHALAGTVDQIADDLVERRERWGISYIGVGLDSLHELAPVVARMAGT